MGARAIIESAGVLHELVQAAQAQDYYLGDCGFVCHRICQDAIARGTKDFFVIEGQVRNRGRLWNHTWFKQNGQVLDPTGNQFEGETVYDPPGAYKEVYRPEKYVIYFDPKKIGEALRVVEDAQRLQSWFAGSKVVDQHGQPLVVYHGSPNVFATFEHGDIGYHFGPQSAATARLGTKDRPGYVRGFYLSIKNPLRTPDAGDWNSDDRVASMFGDMMVDDDAFGDAYERALEGMSEGAGFREILEKMGYDGIVYDNVAEGGGDSWIAFRKTQIKSTANAGAYSGSENVYQ